MRSAYDYIPTIIQVMVLVCIMVRLYHLMVRTGRSVQLVFFAFATIAYLLTDLYWVAFDILYPEIRMPFAANEIGECALFLSITSTLVAADGNLPNTGMGGIENRGIRLSAEWEKIGAVLFTAANAALWIGWSGEWVQDVITAVILSYFYIHLISYMKMAQALSSGLWKTLGMICIAIIAMEAATFHVAEPLKDTLDIMACMLLFVVDLYFWVRAAMAIAPGKEANVSISFSFAAYAWSIIFLYMSSGLFYNIANLLGSFAFLLMFESLRKEAVS